MARNKRIEIRVDEEELRLIGVNAKEHRRTLSDWVRESALLRRPVYPAMSASSAPATDEEVEAATADLRTSIEAAVGGRVISVGTGRQCEKCGKPFASPTLARCIVCNGKIVPPPS